MRQRDCPFVSCERLDDLHVAHVGAQDLGHRNGAVGILVVLHDCRHGATDGKARAVEGVDQACALELRGILVADVRAAGLEVPAVGAGGDLLVVVVAGQPDLEVIALGCGEANVAGAQRDNVVWQA